MARRHKHVRWDNRYNVGGPKDSGRNKERVANTGKGCFFISIGEYRIVYDFIAALNKARGFSGSKTPREYPPIGKGVPDSQIDCEGLAKALDEELGILRGGIQRLETSRDVYKQGRGEALSILESIGQKYPIVCEEISKSQS